MSNSKLTVEKRNETGTLRMRRLRQTGKIPAVLYGHGEGTVMLTAPEKEINKMIDKESHIVDLAGEVTGTALVKDVQWDALGSNVLHLDLARVDADEKVEVNLQIELHGEAPGVKNGGVVMLVQHDITILCPVSGVPDHIICEVGELELDAVISAGDLKLPEGAELTGSPEETIASCQEPKEEVVEETEADADQPEVIGEDKAEEGGE
ncbi:50S ribosomal protein L25 [bacterium]|nr:50S ribosomal protein L25 [bacterium]